MRLHPSLQGLAGAVALLTALLVPVAGGWALLVVSAPSLDMRATYLSGVFTALVGIWAFNKVLYGTRVFHWIGAFLDWCAARGFGPAAGESA